MSATSAVAPATTRGVSTLMYACQRGDVEKVRRLLRVQFASLHQKDRTGKTALHYSATSDVLTAAQAADLLVMAAPDLVETRDEDGFTPLHLAVIAGNIPLVTFLLANNADVNAVDNEKHTVVHWATVCGETEALRTVLAAGAPVATPDVHGGYPLHYAAQMCGGDKDSALGLQVLHTLLSHSEASVAVEDGDGRQPLLWAASAGSARAILGLIRAGAAAEASDRDGLTALHCSASRGHTDCIETLLTLCGASADVIDSNGCTALHYAVTLGHADATALLLSHNADADRRDRKGRSPAHCGCAKGQLETVRMLATKGGADLWTRNARGDLPLHEAAASGRRELVRWLLEARPSQVNARNNDGRCALHLAALNDNADMCKILLDAGAQPNPVLRTSKNAFMTPLDCALQRGYRSTAKFLQLHGGAPVARLGGPPHGGALRLHIRDDVTVWGGDSTTEESERDQKEHMKQQKKKKKKQQQQHQRRRSARKKVESSCEETEMRDLVVEAAVHEPPKIALQQDEIIQRAMDQTKEELQSFVEHEKKAIKKMIEDAEEKLHAGDKKAAMKKSPVRKKEIEKKTTEEYKKSPEHIKLINTEAALEGNAVKEPSNSKNPEEKLSTEDNPKSSEAVTEQKEGENKLNHVGIDETKVNEKETTENEDKTEEKVEETKQKVDELKEKVDETIEKVNETKEKIDETIGKVEETMEKVDEKTEKVNETIDKIDETIEKIDETIEKVDETKQEVDEAIEKVDETIEKIVETKQKVDETNEKVEEMKQKVDETNEKEDETIKKVDETTAKIDETKHKVNEIKHKVDETIEKVDETKEKIKEEINKTKNKIDETLEQKQMNEELERILTIQPEKKAAEEETIKQVNEIIAQDAIVGMPPGTKEGAKRKEETEQMGRKSETVAAINSNETTASVQENKTTTTAETKSTTNERQSHKAQKILLPKTEKSKTKKAKIKGFTVLEPAAAVKTAKEEEPKKRRKKRRKLSDEEKPRVTKEDPKSNTTVSGMEKAREKQRLMQTKLVSPLESSSTSCDDDDDDDDESSDSRKEHRSFTVLDGLSKPTSVPTLPRLEAPQDRCVSNLSAPPAGSVYSDSEADAPPVATGNASRRRRLKKRTRGARETKSAGSDYDVIDSGFEPSPRSSRIPKWKHVSDRGVNMTSVTQTIQGNIRRYHLERKIFQQLLELKRLQIRSGQHNESMLVKRAVDAYHRSCASTVGAGRYAPKDLTFKSFETFLYHALRKLQRNGPDLRGMPETNENPLFCTQSTHKCLHATHAYTGVPCAAYLPKMDHHSIPKIGFDCKPSSGGFLPQINARKAVTLELCHGHDKQVISLPTERLDQNKRYYVTFTVKGTPGDIQEGPASHKHAKSD